MAIAFRAYTSASITNNRTSTVNTPAGVQDDDILIVILTGYNTGTTTAPSGWTQIGSDQDASTDSTTAIFYKFADSEGATQTLTNVWDTLQSHRVTCIVYSGVDTTTPMDVSATQSSTSYSSSPNVPSITPANNGSMIIGVSACDSGASPTGTPDGDATERVDDATRPTTYVQDYLQTTAAAKALSMTATASDFWAVFSIALRAESGGTAYTLTAASGICTLTGTATDLLYNRLISGDAGSIALTGVDSDLLYNRVISADPGSFALTGTVVNLLYNRAISLETGNYTLTGQDATLEYSGAGAPTYTLSAGGGVYTITGSAAALLHNRIITADSDSFALTGFSATLSYSGTPAFVFPLYGALSETVSVVAVFSESTVNGVLAEQIITGVLDDNS